MPLDSEREILVNEAGEHLTVVRTKNPIRTGISVVPKNSDQIDPLLVMELRSEPHVGRPDRVRTTLR